MRKIKRAHTYLKRFSVQISVFFFIVSFAVILIFSSAVYVIVSDIFVKEAVSKASSTLRMSSANIATYIDRIKGESGIFAENPALLQYLSGSDESLKGSLLHQIDTYIENDRYIKSIAVVSKDGRILSNEKNLDMSLSGDMMKESWYTDAIRDNMPILTGARMQSFKSDQEDWVISISNEITGSDGKNLGVLLMDMKYDVIEDHTRNMDLGKTGAVFLVNEKQEPVYAKDTSYFTDKEKKEQLVSLLKKGDSYDEHENILTYHTKIENAGWTMIGVISLDGLVTLEHQLFTIVVLVGLFLLAAVIFCAALFTKRLAGPMADLEKGMREIEKLEEIRIRKNSFYEVEVLASHYNEMIQKIKQLMEELSQKEKTLRQSEINALISQINPHFLYNTLDTIVWMAEFNNSEKVISLTKSLASFFRLSLNEGKELISIGEELEHVSQYLYIQKERYEDKLDYRISVEESLMEYTIPKITLQPIVENSIYHGIKPMDENGLIEISAFKTGEKLQFTVKDNGVGFDKEREQDGNEVKLGGVGIRNVDQRIKLYYGNDCGVEVKSIPGQGCTVKITIKEKPSLLK